MNCACAVVTNNSILQAGTRCERERERERQRVDDTTLFPRSPNWRTSSSREASRRHSDWIPIPLVSSPSIHPSVWRWPVSRSAGRERPSGFQNAWTTSNRVTALRPLNSSCHPLAHIDVPLRDLPLDPRPILYRTFTLRRKRASRRRKLVARHGWKVGRLHGDLLSSPSLYFSLYHLFGTNEFGAAGHSQIDVSEFSRDAIISQRTVTLVCMSQLFWRRTRCCDATKMFVDRWPRWRCAIIVLLRADFAVQWQSTLRREIVMMEHRNIGVKRTVITGRVIRTGFCCLCKLPLERSIARLFHKLHIH